ncbi:MAG: MerR family transcriptional regulator, partial [Vicinamibacterales bacterium]
MAAAKRELFKSLDVCEMAQLQPYVLRSWEAEFPGLGQPASAGGGRIYRRVDVELVLRIKRLVFGEGLTLAGARRRLEEEPRAPSVPAMTVDDALGDMARSKLRQVRTGLEAIMRLLSRDADRTDALELQLVPPPSLGLKARARAASKSAVSAERRPPTKSAARST